MPWPLGSAKVLSGLFQHRSHTLVGERLYAKQADLGRLDTNFRPQDDVNFVRIALSTTQLRNL